MTADHARQILDFVAAHKNDVSTIICQCEAGMSRSAGVAAALSHILQGQNKYLYANFEPNKWVYRTIIDEYPTLSDFAALLYLARSLCSPGTKVRPSACWGFSSK